MISLIPISSDTMLRVRTEYRKKWSAFLDEAMKMNSKFIEIKWGENDSKAKDPAAAMQAALIGCIRKNSYPIRAFITNGRLFLERLDLDA